MCTHSFSPALASFSAIPLPRLITSPFPSLLRIFPPFFVPFSIFFHSGGGAFFSKRRRKLPFKENHKFSSTGEHTRAGENVRIFSACMYIYMCLSVRLYRARWRRRTVRGPPLINFEESLDSVLIVSRMRLLAFDVWIFARNDVIGSWKP